MTLIARHDCDKVNEGVRCLPLPRRGHNRWKRLIVDTWSAARLALSLKADLYHFHDPELLPAMRWLSRKTSAPVVWDVHEHYYASIAYNNSLRLRPLSKLVGILFNRLELASCRHRFRGVVAVSDTMVPRYSFDGLVTRVVGNYPNLDQIPPFDPSRRAPRPLLVSIGAQYGPKGAYECADAYVQLRQSIDCDMAFWGTFHPPKLAEDLRHRTAPRRPGERPATVEGPVPWPVLMGDLLPRAWIGFVLFETKNPNYRLGHPNRFFEMWAAGVPVVVTDGTEVARIVREVGGGIPVRDNQPNTLAEAVRRLLADEPELRAMGRRGRQAIEEKYNWQAAADNLLDLYAQLGISPKHPIRNHSNPEVFL